MTGRGWAGGGREFWTASWIDLERVWARFGAILHRFGVVLKRFEVVFGSFCMGLW